MVRVNFKEVIISSVVGYTLKLSNCRAGNVALSVPRVGQHASPLQLARGPEQHLWRSLPLPRPTINEPMEVWNN